jgi:hypothetical protein
MAPHCHGAGLRALRHRSGCTHIGYRLNVNASWSDQSPSLFALEPFVEGPQHAPVIMTRHLMAVQCEGHLLCSYCKGTSLRFVTLRAESQGSENTDGKLPTSAPNTRSRQGDTQEVGMARLQRRLLRSCAAAHQRESHNAFMSGSVQSCSASGLPFLPCMEVQ